MPIRYEWVCEVVDLESGDREDLYFADSLSDAMNHAKHAPAKGYAYEIALWRHCYTPQPEIYGWNLLETQYAYLTAPSGECWVINGLTSTNGVYMPLDFDGNSRVPKKFINEVRKYVDTHDNIG